MLAPSVSIRTRSNPSNMPKTPSPKYTTRPQGQHTRALVRYPCEDKKRTESSKPRPSLGSVVLIAGHDYRLLNPLALCHFRAICLLTSYCKLLWTHLQALFLSAL